MTKGRRESDIRDTAYKFYLNEEQTTCDDERLYRAFIRGAEWADSNPSESMPSDADIVNIINLVFEYISIDQADMDSRYLSCTNYGMFKYIKDKLSKTYGK